jgi:hypothetical protein
MLRIVETLIIAVMKKVRLKSLSRDNLGSESRDHQNVVRKIRAVSK